MCPRSSKVLIICKYQRQSLCRISHSRAYSYHSDPGSKCKLSWI